MSLSHQAQIQPFLLPPEIVGEIAAQASMLAKFSSLKQCCLVNTMFRDQFQPFIFRGIAIGNDPSLTPNRERNYTSHLVDCIKRNPKLATYVKDLKLNLSSNTMAEDPCLPELLDQLSCISVFELSSSDSDPDISSRCTSWESIAPELRAATVKICALSTIRMLRIASFSELPLCLIENPYLSDLSIGNVYAFSDMDKLCPLATQEVSKPSNHSLSTPSENRFTSLRTFICGYIASMPTDWIQAMMENSTLSTTLWNLSLICLFDETTANSPADIRAQFAPDPSFNLSYLRCLRYLRIHCEVDPLPDYEALAFIEFLKFTSNLINTVNASAPLEELRIIIGDLMPQPLTAKLLSAEWKQLVATIAALRPTLKTIKVKFRFGHCDKQAQLEAFTLVQEVISNDMSGMLLVLKAADGTKVELRT